MSPAPVPDLTVESALLQTGARFVVGCDEVGRGALAGPVAVGVVLIDAGVGEFPAGLRDSKLLSALARERIAPACRSWALAWAVGEATPEEVDVHGIVVALGLAGQRALAALGALPAGVSLLLDGSHDWLTPALPAPLPLTTRIKADQACASVAAASVIAKVHRDGLMTRLHEEWPHYGWAQNKGYGSSAHLGAIAEHGPSPHHRLSWLRPAA